MNSVHRVDRTDELGVVQVGVGTPGEQQVASLVAEGRTNREVAGSLSVTERTIEGHLSNIYAKLGVRSRTELARRLTAEAQPRS